jgi:hypothetical protein
MEIRKILRILLHLTILAFLTLPYWLLNPITDFHIIFSGLTAIPYMFIIFSVLIDGDSFGFYNIKKLETKCGKFYYRIEKDRVLIYKERYFLILSKYSNLNKYSDVTSVLNFLKQTRFEINQTYDNDINRKKLSGYVKEELSTWK